MKHAFCPRYRARFCPRDLGPLQDAAAVRATACAHGHVDRGGLQPRRGAAATLRAGPRPQSQAKPQTCRAGGQAWPWSPGLGLDAR